jgi:hypothetical protein
MENVGIFYDHFEYLWPFGIICGHRVYFVAIWYIFPILVCLDQEKSGNPYRNFEVKSQFLADIPGYKISHLVKKLAPCYFLQM